MHSLKLKEKLDKKSLLIVEDDEISFLVLSEFLEPYNYKIVRAFNGQEAVSLIEESIESFALVLMDLQMPIMNGFEATKIIKQKNKNIPVIAVTAVTFEWNQQVDFSNFEQVMMKPIDFDKLEKAISSKFEGDNISNLQDYQAN